jgi:hypothetical protein
MFINKLLLDGSRKHRFPVHISLSSSDRKVLAEGRKNGKAVIAWTALGRNQIRRPAADAGAATKISVEQKPVFSLSPKEGPYEYRSKHD